MIKIKYVPNGDIYVLLDEQWVHITKEELDEFDRILDSY